MENKMKARDRRLRKARKERMQRESKIKRVRFSRGKPFFSMGRGWPRTTNEQTEGPTLNDIPYRENGKPVRVKLGVRV
jgi:hypothetical protein